MQGIVFIGPALPLGLPTARANAIRSFDQSHEVYEGGPSSTVTTGSSTTGFPEFFFSQVFSEPHPPTHRRFRWLGNRTSPETLIASALDPGLDEQAVRRLAARIRCPVVVIHGSDDAIRSPQSGAALANLISGTFVSLEGSGHRPQARDPVEVNRIVRDFIEPRRKPTSAWTRAIARPRKALYISSPIGLGHALRDVAIAREVRNLHPDLEIDWLAQDPVTRVLEAEGERVHPASADLASESGHFESESAEHDLHCFQAWRRMDEILVNNFMVFQRRSSRPSRTTCGSATRPGRSTTSCTRTPS